MSRVVRASSCSKILAGHGQIDDGPSRAGRRLPAAESGSLSKLRAKKRLSNKLGDAVTVDVWGVEGNVGLEHEAELQHLRASRLPCTGARKPGTSPASSSPTPATLCA